MTKVADVPALAAACRHAVAAAPAVAGGGGAVAPPLLVIDATWASPCVYRPLEHGADAVAPRRRRAVTQRQTSLCSSATIKTSRTARRTTSV